MGLIGKLSASIRRFGGGVFFGLSCLIAPLAAHAQDAAVGRVLMAIGKVEIERGDRTIAAKKDTEVMPGDTIATGTTSNAQIKFVDGAVIALRPESEFRVEEYKFSGKPDGSEKATVSLLKGGVRAVTGAIGRSNRDNLKVNAVVATVGIRGTGFNISFCGASCKAANPAAAEGLYAGVFEGKVVVGNEAGSTSDLGVNRFAYVKDQRTAPVLLVAPPSFLKDSLEGQVRVLPKALAINAASENTASLQNAVATVKAPAAGSTAVSAPPTAEKVNQTPVAIEPPKVVQDLPSKFFEFDAGGGTTARVDTSPTSVQRLRAAEFKPGATISSGDEDNQISLNRIVKEISYEGNSLATTSTDGYKVTRMNVNVVVNGVTESKPLYTIEPLYAAKWKEGGTSGGVVSWGRWAGGAITVGNYGTFNLEENQGWHYIVGTVTQTYPVNSINMTLVGGSKPTELRDNASAGWRLTGGNLAVDFAGRSLSGTLGHYYSDGSGYGNFNTTYAGPISANTPSAVNSFTSSTLRTTGNTALCTASCAGSVRLGFYGEGANIHAGAVYQINTGTNGTIQGVAVYK